MSYFTRWGNQLEISNPRDKWSMYGSNFKDYLRSFGTRIGTLLEEEIRLRESMICIDLLSDTTALRTMKKYYGITHFRGLSVSNSDSRPRRIRELDQSHGITHLNGNLLKSSTWGNIGLWVGQDNQVDIILERGGRGLHYIPNNSLYFGAILNRCLGLLNIGGCMAMQLPPDNAMQDEGINVRAYIEQTPNIANIIYEPNQNLNTGYGCIFIKK